MRSVVVVVTFCNETLTIAKQHYLLLTRFGQGRSVKIHTVAFEQVAVVANINIPPRKAGNTYRLMTKNVSSSITLEYEYSAQP